MKSEINDDLNNIGIYKDNEIFWKSYLEDDVLGLAYSIRKQGNSFQKITGVSYKNSLTEVSLEHSCLCRYLEKDNRIYTHLKTNTLEISQRKQFTVAGFLLVKNCIQFISGCCK